MFVSEAESGFGFRSRLWTVVHFSLFNKMANQSSSSSSNESIDILFHGSIPPMKVFIEGSEALTCEKVLVLCIKHIQSRVCAQEEANAETYGLNKYLPTFGLLALPDDKIWLPFNYVFKKDIDNRRKFMFKVRFRPAADKFSDGNVMCEYLFLQILDDFLKGSLGKSEKLDKETTFGLLYIALLIPQTLPLNSDEKVNETFKSRHLSIWNYTKHFSKAMAKRFITSVPSIIDHFWVFKTLKSEINKFKTHNPPANLGFFKNTFYRLLMKAVPEYCFEIYEATEIHVNSMERDEPVSANIGLYKESGKQEALYYGEAFQCGLRDIVSVEIDKPKVLNGVKKWNVKILLDKELLKVISFSEEGAAESFVSMIQGYFRLCISYDTVLCKELQTSGSRLSSELKSFGPIGEHIAACYLEESKKTIESDSGAFLICESLDHFGKYQVKVRPKSNTHDSHIDGSGMIECLPGTQLKLKMDKEELIFDSHCHLRSYLGQTIGKQVLPVPKYFPILADINNEFQEMKIEYYGPHTSTTETQNTSIGLPVIIDDLRLISEIQDKNPLIRKYEAEFKDSHGDNMMLLVLQSDKGVYAKAFREGLEKLQKLYRIRNTNFLKLHSMVLDAKISALLEFTPHQDVLTYIWKNPQTVTQKVHIMDQIIDILSVMEKGNCYHGNLRLRKFFIFDGQQPGQVKVKLGDPGIVSYFDTMSMGNDNNIERAPWLSPKRRRNLLKITYEDEVFALGTVIYELMCQSDQFHEYLKLSANENILMYLEKNKTLPPPPILADNSKEPTSEEDEANKLFPEALVVLEMMWAIVLKCWSEDEAFRPSVATLIIDMTAVKDKACDIGADTFIYHMKELFYDNYKDKKDMNKDGKEKLTVKEIENRIQTYFNMHILDMSCIDMEGYTNKLGSGKFGSVFKGKVRPPEKRLLLQNSDHKSKKLAEQNSFDWRPVAVKRINRIVNGKILDPKSLYREIRVACELDHPNVVKLLHLCCDKTQKELSQTTEFDPMMMIMEFMSLGNLSSYAETYVALSDADRVSHMLKILIDVAEGMVYLSGKEIVHCDLAARNVLLTVLDDGTVTAKVSDFGLARIVEGNYRFYKLSKEDVLPKEEDIFWMPPECFISEEATDNKFSSRGDVWSFGVVMWESLSRSATKKTVLQTITAEALLEKYKSGWRLTVENNLCNHACNVMNRCWEMDPNKRPPFVELVQKLKKLIKVTS